MRDVYYRAGVVDDLALRIACLKLVVPDSVVVTDRSAAWLWGATMALAPNDHLTAPRVSVFCPPGHRLRNGLAASGERMLRPEDVREVDGLRVTSPLRTAADLGRLLHRDQAFAAMDALAALGDFVVPELVAATPRFKGYRGVIQLRELAPMVDPRSQSQAESILRLRWIDRGIPTPELQWSVPALGGGRYYLDLALPGPRFGAEYDGEEFHGEGQRSHDEVRRTWLRGPEDWIIVVIRRSNLFGQNADVDQLLDVGYRRALNRR